MDHRKHPTTFLLAFLILISALLLASPSSVTHAGPGLPPRETPTPTRPPDEGDDDKDDKPAGAHIILQVQSALVGVWTVVQWQDSAGGWHDIEGWSGALDEGNQKVWWVAAKDFGTGPFRWLVYQGQGGKQLAQSELFYLPHSVGETVKIQVSLVPSQPTQRSTSISTLPYPSPDGSYIELQVRPRQAGLWAVVQWQDSAGGWHDIEGWQGTLEEGHKQVWWVAPDIFGKGPFRWAVYQSQGGQLLATSDSFYLPDSAGKKVRVGMSLSE